jgi:predicted hydrocarbon binding protein
MDRKTFLKSLAAATVSLPCLSRAAITKTGKCDGAQCMSDAAAVRQFLSDFLTKEEINLKSDTLLKLMNERGHACCRALDFRQKLIEDSQGSVDKLVELMGKIVGPENCRREGNKITLVYPVTKCICGWSPARAPSPDDPYCNCSAANNQLLFQTVYGKPVKVNVVESPRRGGQHCRFDIQLA